MADYNMDNAAKAALGTKVGIGDFNGRVRHLFDEIELSNKVYAIGDELHSLVIPEGARVLSASIQSDDDLGGAGIVEVGYLASASGAIVKDSDGFIDTADFGHQAYHVQNGVSSLREPGILKKFDEPVQAIITFTEASESVYTAANLLLSIQYVID